MAWAEGTFFSLGTDSKVMVLHCCLLLFACLYISNVKMRHACACFAALLGANTINDGGPMAALPSAEAQRTLRRLELLLRQQALLAPLDCAGKVGHEAGLGNRRRASGASRHHARLLFTNGG